MDCGLPAVIPLRRELRAGMLDNPGQWLLVLDYDFRVRIFLGNGETLFLQKRNMLLDPPLSLVEAVLDRMADPCKPLQIGRIEPEKGRIISGLNNQRAFQI